MTTQVQTGQDAEAPGHAVSGADPYPPTPFDEIDIGDPPKATTNGNDPPAQDSGGSGGG